MSLQYYFVIIILCINFLKINNTQWIVWNLKIEQTKLACYRL